MDHRTGGERPLPALLPNRCAALFVPFPFEPVREPKKRKGAAQSAPYRHGIELAGTAERTFADRSITTLARRLIRRINCCSVR